MTKNLYDLYKKIMKACSNKQDVVQIIDDIEDLDDAKHIIKMLLTHINNSVSGDLHSLPYIMNSYYEEILKEAFVDKHEVENPDVDFDVRNVTSGKTQEFIREWIDKKYPQN
jgi:hypothetical protein